MFEKAMLLSEISMNEKYVLQPMWVFKDMKVTFQELFQLGPEDDDKLLPIVSHRGLLAMAPSASFEGLTLLGKKGEVKGTITGKKKHPGESTLFGLKLPVHGLQYKDPEGKLVTSKIKWGQDAYTIRWKDIKDRIADEMSEAKAIENLRLERDWWYSESD
ncbi:hypothetical protein MYX65_13050, partial [Acidobacteria bacterium AH-259-L09]|nr:hypothetical protein [Acidobacteria bacterium AH-259-L09]